MSKKILLAGIAASIVALGAPAASADHAQYACDFTGVSLDTGAGGRWYAGVLGTWVASPGEEVHIDCWLVIGTDRGPGVAASGTTFADDAEPVAFHADEDEDVYACYEVTVGAHTESGCNEVHAFEIPPPVDWDWSGESPLCEAPLEVAGDYHPFGIDREGDVFFDFNDDGDYGEDEWLWDCPKYFYTGEDQADGGFDY